MLTTILVIAVSIAAIIGIGVATRSIVKRKIRKDGKNAGLAIAAATIDHILENGTDLADITKRTSTITSRWAAYDADAYQGQRDSLNRLGKENRESGDR